MNKFDFLLENQNFSFVYNRLIFGLENGLVVIDYLSQFILMNMATGDLYGTMDPFQRAALSPKRRGPSNDSNNDESNVFSYEYQVKKSHQFFSCVFFLLHINKNEYFLISIDH